MCRALARGDEHAAIAAMTTPPPADSDRHQVVGRGDGLLLLRAHGQEWETTEEEFFAGDALVCPVCHLDLDDPGAGPTPR